MKNKWFTLIEILIVIVIISILLLLTLGISGGRIQILKEKYIQEQFVSQYNTLFSRNFLTNYYGESLYDKLIINMKQWEWWFSYCYDIGGSCHFEGALIQWGKYEIGALSLEWSSLNSIDINFEPYKFWCVLSGSTRTWEKLDIKLSIGGRNNCYQINSDLCRLEKKDCD